jgi:DNA-binding SARP family transcriptional activator/predicted ATPase
MSLVLQLLGTVQITWDGKALKFATEHTRALLAYLAVEADVVHRRTTVATLLWPEENEATARHNLRQALFFLKQTLAAVPHRDSLLQVTSTTMQWHNQAITVDLRAFQAWWRLSQGHNHALLQPCAACVEHFTQVVALYQGEFLQGLLLKENHLFEEWALLLREQTHRQALAMLNALTTHHEQMGTYDRMQHYAARQVALEPWQEASHRQLMLALAAQGQPSAALRQYESCRRILKEELGAPPSAETTRLYEQIRTGNFDKVRGWQGEGVTGDKVNPDHPVTPSPPHPLTLSPPHPVTPSRLHNLPINLAPLVGRSEQLIQLHSLMGQARLLTIVGMGGMGKSRLALALLEQLAAETPAPFAHGVWFVSLVGVAANANMLADALAGAALQALGITTPNQDALQPALIHHLAARQALLVFDNMEQLLVAETSATIVTDFIHTLLHAAPGVTLVVTSRLPLQLLAETVIRLEGLAVPGVATVDRRDVANYESIRLFLYHAQRALPSFTLRDDNLSAVVDLCRTLSGMPLAIQLAAALTPHFTPSELVTAVRANLALLASTRRDLDARHRQFDAVLQSSWQLLSPREQQVLAQCSLFVERFSRAAAQAVTGATVSDLAGLVDQSLVQQPEVGVYQLHDLLRHFAHQQLLAWAAHDRTRLHARYVDYYLGLVTASNAQLRQRGAQATVAQLRQVSENCHRAWAIALEARWFEPMNSAIDGWRRYWQMTGGYRAGETMVASALAVLEALTHEPLTEPQTQTFLAKLWLTYAYCLYGQERFQASMTAAEKATALALVSAEEAIYSFPEKFCTTSPAGPMGQNFSGDLYANGLALFAKGLSRQSRHAEARPFAERAYQSGVWEAQIDALITLAGCEKQVQAHVAVTAQALQIARQQDDPYLILLCTQEMAGSYENEGYYADSLPYRAQALQLAYEIQDAYHTGEAHYCYGLVHAHVGLFETAIEHFQRALSIAQEEHVEWLERRTLNRLARSYYCLGQFETAYTLICQVQTLCRQEDLLPTFFDFTYAQILAALGRRREAEVIYQQILTRKRMGKGAVAPAQLPELAELARLALWQGDRQEALRYVEEILALVSAHPHRFMPDLYFDAYAIDLACYEILHALSDSRAPQLLQSSYQRLCAQLEPITDPTVRRSYLENIAAHRTLHQAYRNAF